MEQMKEFLYECLKSVDLEAVTKADLKQKYLKEKGLTKLSNEDKVIFSSLVETVYMNVTESKPLNTTASENKNDSKVTDSSIVLDNKNGVYEIDSDGSDLAAASQIKSKENTQIHPPEDSETSKIATDTIQEEVMPNSIGKDNFNNSMMDTSSNFSECKPKLETIDSDKSCKLYPLNDSKDTSEKNLLLTNSEISGCESFEAAKKQRKVLSEKLVEESEEDDEPLISVKKNMKNRNFSALESDDESESPIKKRSKKISLSNSSNVKDGSLINGEAFTKNDISDESEVKELKKNKAVKSNSNSNRIKKETTPKRNTKKSNKALNQSFDTLEDSDNDDFQAVLKSPYNRSKKNIKDNFLESKKKSIVGSSNYSNKKTSNSKKTISDLTESPLVSNSKKKLKKNVKDKDVSQVFDSDEEPIISLKSAKKNVGLDSEVSSVPFKVSSSESEDEPLMSLSSKNKNNCSDVSLDKLKTNKQSSTSDNSCDKSSKKRNTSSAEKAKNNSKISNAKKRLNFSKESPVSKKKMAKKVSSTPIIASGDSDEDPLICLKLDINNKKSSETNIDDTSDSDVPLVSLKNKEQINSVSNLSSDESDEEPLISLKLNKNENSHVKESNTLSLQHNELSTPLKFSGDESDYKRLSSSKKQNLSKLSLKKELISDSDEDFLSVKKKANKSSSLSLLDTSDSEEEPLILKKSSKKVSTNRNISKKISSPVKKLKNQNNKSKKRKLSKSNIDESEALSSDSEDEPLVKFSKKKSKKEAVKRNSTKNKKSVSEKKLSLKKSKSRQTTPNKDKIAKKSLLISSESDDEPLATYSEQKMNLPDTENCQSADIENEEIKTVDKSQTEEVETAERPVLSSSESDDEPLVKHKNNLSGNKHLNADKVKNSSDSFVSSDSENEENLASVKEKTKKEQVKQKNPKVQKKFSASENKLENLKKYIRCTGLRVQSYSKLFENCKSLKSKCEKLQQMLEKEGLKGRPTLEKCKKLRKKIETKKEVAELDLSNIITKDCKKRTACIDTTNHQEKSEETQTMKTFSRLKGIIDSEESD